MSNIKIVLLPVIRKNNITNDMTILMDKLRANDSKSWINLLWEVLDCYRENCISGQAYDDEWSDICLIMTWIEDSLK
jgi:hypothetical protein